MTMKDTRSPERPRALRALLVGAAAGALVLGAAAAPATAKPPRDPNTAVANDGSVTVAPASASLRGVSGFHGTGIPGDDGAVPAPGPLPADTDAPGGIGVQSVIGPDGRVRVDPTTAYPARATVYLTRTTDGVNQQRWCSGWLYAPDMVATAGHCVHGGKGGNWVPGGELRIWPGRNGDSAPYGFCTARQLHSVVGWVENGDPRYDYAAIKLNCTVGNTVGWYGWWWQTASLNGQPTTVSGYPSDKPAATQWTHSDQVRSTQDRRVFYQNDTYHIQSGSPVFQFRPDGPYCAGFCSMAIHAYGSDGTNNSGTRIVEAVHNNLVAWRDQP